MLLLLLACSLECLVKDDVAIVCRTGVMLLVTDAAGEPVPAYTVGAVTDDGLARDYVCSMEDGGCADGLFVETETPVPVTLTVVSADGALAFSGRLDPDYESRTVEDQCNGESICFEAEETVVLRASGAP